MTLLAHCAGVFGLYDKPLFVVHYDHFVNFMGGIAAAWICFDLIKPGGHGNPRQRLVWTATVFVAALGVCALVQIVEHWCAGLLGSGEGLFRFGGLGDTLKLDIRMYTAEARAGAWENQANDLHFALLGSVSAIIFRQLTLTIQRRFKGLPT